MNPVSRNVSRGLLLCGLLAVGSAHALNVDCAKIANQDENAICSEVALPKLDKEMDNAYKLANAQLPLRMRDQFKNIQALWLTSPDSPRSGACKGDVACITAKYKARIAFFGNPNFRYEGVYKGKGANLTVVSMPEGKLKVSLAGADPAKAMNFDESRGLKIVNAYMQLPPPAENCSLGITFSDGAAVVAARPGKKKACDGVKALVGTYTHDYNTLPTK